MNTKDKVVEWLGKHQVSANEHVVGVDYNHFVKIMTDVADYCLNRQLAESAKWITENLGAAAGKEYLEEMKSHD